MRHGLGEAKAGVGHQPVVADAGRQGSRNAFFQKGFDLYKTYQDKSWGLVDCISFIVMREAGIADALTTDSHYEQAGFNVLLKA